MTARPASRPPRRRAPRSLSPVGELETEILVTVDELGGVTVRDVYESLRARRTIAYTTCMTVMGSLTRKGLLRVDRSDVAYFYRSRVSARELGESLVDIIVARLWRGDRGPAVAHLLGRSGTLDEGQLAALRAEAEARLQPRPGASTIEADG
jgi:predicted transcriptional regulator